MSQSPELQHLLQLELQHSILEKYLKDFHTSSLLELAALLKQIQQSNAVVIELIPRLTNSEFFNKVTIPLTTLNQVLYNQIEDLTLKRINRSRE